MHLRDYTILIWEKWRNHEYLIKHQSIKMIIKWCWPHICGFISSHSDPYDKLPKQYHAAFKRVVLHYFRLMKVALHYPVLVTLINELWYILNTKVFYFDQPLAGPVMSASDFIERLNMKDMDEEIDGAHLSLRQGKRAKAEANRIFEAIDKSDSKEEGDDQQKSDKKYFKRVCNPNSDEVDIAFSWRPNQKFIRSEVGAFRIPCSDIRVDGDKLVRGKQNHLYCPDLWIYLLRTIAFLPLFNAMSTGGTAKESNMEVEGINRLIKTTEGVKNYRFDRYISTRNALNESIAQYFSNRIRENNAKSMIRKALLKDMWNSKHQKTAEKPIDVLAQSLFQKMAEYEHSVNLKHGAKRLKEAFVGLLAETGHINHHDLHSLSEQMFRQLKGNKAIEYSKPHCVSRFIYFILWMAYRLKTKWNDDSVDCSVDKYPFLSGFELIDTDGDNDIYMS